MNFIKLVALFSTACFFSALNADVTSHLDQIKNDPNALYAFLKTMPKGGELHYHLEGGPYPETMLDLASKGNYCIDPISKAASKTTAHCDGIPSKDIYKHPSFYSAVVNEWSMKDFVAGKQSGHDHFFDSFNKYMSIISDHRPELLANIIQRAAEQHEQYLEIMTIPDDANSVRFGDLIKNGSSYEEKKQQLLNNKEFQDNITHTLLESDRILAQAYQHLGCTEHPQLAACNIKIKFLYFTLREQPLNNVFAQTLNAFEAASRSKSNIVGVNLVQPEDGIISLRDYHQQMLIFNYFHQAYPKVNIALHAGELAPEAIVPEELGYHIHDAIMTGHAQRIGHGVSIAYENNAESTLKHMADNQLAVEINLISNQKILNISGFDHPLNYYLSHHVPVILSTDDEGILRTDLTRQYVEAVLHHGLNYPQLKQISRNSLSYAFVPGKSIWANANKAVINQECMNLDSKNCLALLKNSEKAALQWDLEQKLKVFESQF